MHGCHTGAVYHARAQEVFWSHDGFTNMLDYGAEQLKLRQLDTPANFFSGNNCVAEYGQFPTNFLLGVSTPGNDIQFRCQMRSRQRALSTLRVDFFPQFLEHIKL
jgi:hypothetical protein